jgi:hypothetical protein
MQANKQYRRVIDRDQAGSVRCREANATANLLPGNSCSPRSSPSRWIYGATKSSIGYPEPRGPDGISSPSSACSIRRPSSGAENPHINALAAKCRRKEFQSLTSRPPVDPPQCVGCRFLMRSKVRLWLKQYIDAAAEDRSAGIWPARQFWRIDFRRTRNWIGEEALSVGLSKRRRNCVDAGAQDGARSGWDPKPGKNFLTGARNEHLAPLRAIAAWAPTPN